MNDLTELLNNPEEHYPGNFDTPQRANAVLTGLCQDAANEIKRLNAEVLEQCRINGMSAEREDALKAELTRLKASIALDWMAKNARDLGLDYEPARQDVPETNFGNTAAQPAVQEPFGTYMGHRMTPDGTKEFWGLADTPIPVGAKLYTTPPAQPAVQEGRDWSLLEATQESLREHMAEIKRLKAAQPAPLTCKHEWFRTGAMEPGECRCINCGMWNTTTPPVPQPVPVKTYHDGKPWPVAPAPDPAPIIQQLVTALEGSGTRMRSDQWYVEIEAVAAGKFYLNSKGEGL
jgi:hypothetical protein